MPEEQHVRYRRLVRSVRPPRLLTFVCGDDKWRADILRMMENYSRTWGGEANALVGVSNTWHVHEAFWKLIEAVDPDHFATFARTLRGFKLSEPEAYEEWLHKQTTAWVEQHGGTEEVARQQFEHETNMSSPLGGWRASDEVEERIRTRLAPLNFGTLSITRTYRPGEAPPHGAVDMCQLTYRPERVTTINHSALPDPVRLLIAATTGELAPGHLEHLTEVQDFDHRVVDVEPTEVVQLLEFCWAGRVDTLVPTLISAQHGGTAVAPPEFASQDFVRDTPLNQARLGCTQFRVVEPSTLEMPAVIIAGDSADDFCYWFSRRHICGDTFWLPTKPEPDDPELHSILLQTFTKVLWHLYSTSPTGNRKILLSSLTITREQLEALLTELQGTIWGNRINSNGTGELDVSVCLPEEIPVRRTTFLLDSAHPNDSLSEPFIGTDLEKDLEIPLPSEAVGLTPHTLRWQVDVEMAGHMLPTRSSLHPILCIGSHEHWATRSSKYGISVDSHGRTWSHTGSPLSQLLVRLRLRYPPPEEIFKTLLAESGARLEISDKGRYSERMLELWGGLDELANDLRTGPVSTLLNYWVRSREEEDLGRYYQGRRYISLAGVRTIALIDDEEARALLDRYVHNEIVSRGFVLRCSLCSAHGFYRVEDIGNRFQCVRCRRSNELLAGSWQDSVEPEWCYALDEIVYLGLINNASVPILGMAELAKGSRSFLHMPEARIIREGQKDIEIDIWTIIDGAITLGEAKKEDYIEKTNGDERYRLATIRDLLTAITADAWVMATASGDWNERTKRNVNDKISKVADIRWLKQLR